MAVVLRPAAAGWYASGVTDARMFHPSDASSSWSTDRSNKECTNPKNRHY